MKHLYALCVFIFTASASAQVAAANGYCNLGGAQSVTSGLSSSNYLQGIIPSCSVTVYLTGTTTLATIYADSNLTILNNPFTANAASSTNPGYWLFFAAINQGYDVVLSGGVSPNIYPSAVTLTALYPGTDIIAGITQLTGDVTAGPGNGAQVATVVRVNGAAIPTLATVLGSNSSSQLIAASTTGSGNVVLSASPTLTGTLTAAAANLSGAITLQNYTGYLYCNGSSSICNASTTVPYSSLSGTVPTWNQNTTGTAANITATSNTTLTSLVNLATVGTITTGTWNGTVVSTTFGGTGQNWSSSTGIPSLSSGTFSLLSTTGSGSVVLANGPTIGSIYITGVVTVGTLSVQPVSYFYGPIDATATGGATSSLNASSPVLSFIGSYYNSLSTDSDDTWTVKNVVGTGTTPTSTFTFAHLGSTGTASISMHYSISTGVITESGSTTNTFSGSVAGVALLSAINSGSAGVGIVGSITGAGGVGIQGSATSGTAIWGNATSGEGVYGSSTTNLGVHGGSLSGSAGYFVQEGTLTSSTTNSTLYVYRNQTLGSYTSTGAIISANDASGSGTDLMDLAVSSSNKFSVSALGAISTGVITESGSGTNLFTNTTSTGYSFVASFYQPNLPTSLPTYISIGVNSGTYNQSNLGFTYINNNSTANNGWAGVSNVDHIINWFGTGDVTIGTTTDSGYKLEVNGSLASGAITESSTSSNTFINTLSASTINSVFSCPNIPTSNGICSLALGQAHSNWNEILMYFNFNGSGSTTNSGSLGLYGNNNMINWFGTGDVTVATFTDSGYKFQVAGTTSVNSGTNQVYRCTTASTLPVGALTINTANCSASTATGLYVP
jgi:hypothetical protein